jgi:eukaryotic-like serine/threonine-protein kinase
VPDWAVPGYTGMKRIGSGGFGEVLLARHDASGTLVAIKYLRRDLLADADSAEMFRSEAAVLASLDDPNIVRLYEYVESPSGAAIVMELVGGVSLREILTYQGKTTPEAALVVLQGSLLGLATAHRRGIVHRDYKPENVLVNGDGVSKLTDFGIAARSGGFAAAAGTLRYAAPEQMAGAVSTPAGDIYAATATFYECLTGRPPFRGEAEDLLDKHRTEPVPLDQVPEPLRPLVAAGMAKDPGGRPVDATAFVDEMRAVASTAYGRAWQEHGRSHLSEAVLLLAALWPSGAPPTVQGTSVYRVPLRKRPRLWHAGPAKAGIAAGIAVAAAAAGTALAVSGGPRTSAAEHPVAAVQSVPLQPSPGPAPSTGTLSSPAQTVSSGDTTSRAGAGSPGLVGPTTRSVAAPPTTKSVAPPPTTKSVAPPPTTKSVAPPPTTNTATSPPPPPTTSAPAVPRIVSVGTHTQGVLVYFDIQYADPGNDAEGFGFVGVNGSGWAEENHPFSSPSYGIVGTDSISYPFNEACGTTQQYTSYVEAWINDTAGDRSAPVVIQLACAGGVG